MERGKMAEALKSWKKIDFEEAAVKKGIVCVALRSEKEWNEHPQSAAISRFPLTVDRITSASNASEDQRWQEVPRSLVQAKPLAGIRVVEFSRVSQWPSAELTVWNVFTDQALCMLLQGYCRSFGRQDTCSPRCRCHMGHCSSPARPPLARPRVRPRQTHSPARSSSGFGQGKATCPYLHCRRLSAKLPTWRALW